MSALKRQLKKQIRKVYFTIFDSWFFDIKNSRYFSTTFEKHRKELTDSCSIVEALTGERILILAPHCDDEVIGCGGAILSSIEAGKEVFIAYMTNGQKQGNQENAHQVIEARQQEAYNVAREVGISRENLFFLGGIDGDLLNSPVEGSLAEVIIKVRPDTILLPVTLDNHVDHYATSQKLLLASERLSETLGGITLYLYESQSPLTLYYANTCLQITKYLTRKKELLSLFKSQPYPFKFVMNLNQANGKYIGPEEAAETYLKVEFEAVKRFIHKYFSDDTEYFKRKERLVPNKHSASLISSYQNSLDEKKILRELL